MSRAMPNPEGFAGCKICGKQPVLDKISCVSGFRYVYRCPDHPSLLGGVRMEPSLMEAKLTWNINNGKGKEYADPR